ncbi:MAG: YfhO family protein, partial [Lachnospiraceae bacterium]|nr:YfhO family protein [Lachnospiraceae bacterium]
MINKKRLKKEILLCLLVCTAAAVLSLIYFIIRGGGAFTVVDDFNKQEIPFNTAMHNAVSLGGEWNWGLDLGTANIHGFGFYGLGGVYAWIMMLFPSSMVPYLIGWGYVLKYTVAGLTSFLWLRKFVKDYRFAVVGALLYAFSGFQTANLEFYHFHDVVSFFPLLLLSLDHFEEKYRQSDQLLSREGLLFSAAVAVNCLCNY